MAAADDMRHAVMQENAFIQISCLRLHVPIKRIWNREEFFTARIRISNKESET